MILTINYGRRSDSPSPTAVAGQEALAGPYGHLVVDPASQSLELCTNTVIERSHFI